jgi:hypothetical protein
VTGSATPSIAAPDRNFDSNVSLSLETPIVTIIDPLEALRRGLEAALHEEGIATIDQLMWASGSARHHELR